MADLSKLPIGSFIFSYCLIIITGASQCVAAFRAAKDLDVKIVLLVGGIGEILCGAVGLAALYKRHITLGKASFIVSIMRLIAYIVLVALLEPSFGLIAGFVLWILWVFYQRLWFQVKETTPDVEADAAQCHRVQVVRFQ